MAGVEWTVDAGPAVVTDGVTVVHMSLFPTEGEAMVGSNVFTTLFGTPGDFIGGIGMVDLAGSAYYMESGGSDEGMFSSASAEKPVELNPLFAAVPDGTTEVALFLPQFGVIPGIPVVSSTEVFDVAATLAASSPDLEDAGPYPMRTLVGVDDGSSATEDEQDTTTVVLSSDVTFASDSAELSAQADAVLSAVTAAVGRYPPVGPWQ